MKNKNKFKKGNIVFTISEDLELKKGYYISKSAGYHYIINKKEYINKIKGHFDLNYLLNKDKELEYYEIDNEDFIRNEKEINIIKFKNALSFLNKRFKKINHYIFDSSNFFYDIRSFKLPNFLYLKYYLIKIKYLLKKIFLDFLFYSLLKPIIFIFLIDIILYFKNFINLKKLKYELEKEKINYDTNISIINFINLYKYNYNTNSKSVKKNNIDNRIQDIKDKIDNINDKLSNTSRAFLAILISIIIAFITIYYTYKDFKNEKKELQTKISNYEKKIIDYENKIFELDKKINNLELNNKELLINIINRK